MSLERQPFHFDSNWDRVRCEPAYQGNSVCGSGESWWEVDHWEAQIAGWRAVGQPEDDRIAVILRVLGAWLGPEQCSPGVVRVREEQCERSS